MTRIKKNPFFLKYFLPVFFIIFLIIGLSGMAFYISLIEINELIEVSNTQILGDVRSSLDERLKQVGNIIFILSEDREVDDYLNSPQISGKQSYYVNDKLSLKLNNMVNYLNYLDNVFLFIKEKNQVISNTGPYDWDKFINIRLINDDDTSGFKDSEFHYMTFDRIQYWDNNLEKRRDSLCMKISLPLMNTNNPQALATMIISPSLFKGFFDDESLLSEGSLFIINEAGKILFQKGKIQDFAFNWNEFDNLFSQTERRDVFITEKSNQTIAVTASSFNGIYYISVIPEKVFFDISHYLQLVLVSFIVFSLFAGLLYSLFFAWQKSTPLSRIYHSLISEDSIAVEKRGLPDIEKRVEELNLTVKLYQPVIRENVVRKLLFGSDNTDIEKELDKVGIMFPHNEFCVAIIQNSLKNRQGINIESMIAGFVEKQISPHTFELVLGNNEIYVLCCLNENPEGDYHDLTQKLNMVLNQIKLHISREYFICLGLVHKGLAGISTSYREAQKAGDIGRYRLENDVIDYGRLQRPNQQIIYPIDLERKLATALAAGEKNKAHEALEGILAHSFSGELISSENAQFLFYELINTTIKTIKRLQEDEGIVFPDGFLPERLLKETNSITGMKSQMFLIIDKICELVNLGSKQQKLDDAEKFYSYIAERYQDPNLDLETISFDFEYSASYFSVYFMKIMEEKFKQYLTRFRINRAMELINSGETSIDDILHRVGYTNYMTFNRNFKKIYNLSPKAYLNKGKHHE